MLVPTLPLGDYPRSLIDRLDHWTSVAPDRGLLADRGQDGEWRKGDLIASRAACPRHRPVPARQGAERRAAADDPFGKLAGTCAAVARDAPAAHKPAVSPAHRLVSTTTEPSTFQVC